MRYKYLTIDTSTPDGLKRAERLKMAGYHMEVVGIDKVMFSIPVK